MKSHNSSTVNHPCISHHGITTTTFHHLLLLILVLSPSFIPRAAAQQPSDSPGDNLNTSNVSPSVAVIVIVLVLAFFITGTVSIYIQHCAESSSSLSPIVVIGTGAGDGQSRRGQIRGLDKSVIDAFPTFLYSEVKELKIGKGSLECAICLNEFEEDETLKLLPKCDHVFHPDCIDTWLAGHTTCPVCRANLVPEQAQIANSAESTHPIGAEGEPEIDNESQVNTRCEEVQITINDQGMAIPNRKFPRSHSTGHSLSRPGEDWERFTLRLPAEVRRQLVARARLKRATSLVALPRESSSRRGYRGDGEGSGSSRYGRLFNFLVPPFVSRGGSVRSSTKVTDNIDVKAETAGSKRYAGNAVTPLETLPPLPV
uniref:RING-type E3 ubiquitin transferase n=1 Tax=Opuntia streptacantha TaxID=393608 RepID=A0A7C9E4F8_OPUST